MRKIIYIFISILLIVSCNTVTGLMQPDWVVRTPRIVGAVAYVGMGQSPDLVEAKNLAYQDVLSLLGADLGYDLSTQYFRELIGTDQIKALSLNVTEHYETQSSDGIYTYYAFAKTPQSTLSSSRSPEYIALLEREARIEKKLADALDSYKNNNDIDTIDKVLEAILISLEGDVKNPEYTPDSLLKKVEEYAQNIKITLSKAKKDDIGVTVKVKRTKGLFYPPVVNARINATYSMMNASGEIIQSSFEGKTDSKGRMIYSNTNPYVVRNGYIDFSIAVNDELLSKIESETSAGFTAGLREIISDKSVRYNYSIESGMNGKNTIICYALSDEAGNTIHIDSFKSSLVDYLSSSGLELCHIVELPGEEAFDIFDQASHLYLDYKYFIIIRSGIAGYITTEKEVASRADGRVAIFERGAEEAFMIQDSFMLGYGQSEEEAAMDAFANEARIIAGRLLQVL